MVWYYRRGDEQVGPLDDTQLQAHVEQGEIQNDTPIWHEGLPQWSTWGALSGADAVNLDHALCAECGQAFSMEDMVRFGDSWVCAKCKPVFFQRLREGAVLPGVLNYAGFWPRAGAMFIDGIIFQLISTALAFIFIPIMDSPQDAQSAFTGGWILLQATMLIIGISYYTVFIGKFGATPGKMAMGLRVIRPDGSRLTYLRAFARYWAYSLSGIILGIGYLMAISDSEKRTLHDRICDTRVIRKKK
jgi:uncharacterized RDD family membrane protein YckC/ribosomal protein S27AE